MRIAKTAVTAPHEDEPLAGAGEVGEHFPIVLVHDLGADRDTHHEILTMRAGPIAPGARPAVLRPEMLPIPVIDERIEVLGRGKDDVAAPAAITAVRAAELDEFLAAETHCAAASVTALQVDLALVEELHRNPEEKKGSGRRSPRVSARFGEGLF